MTPERIAEIRAYAESIVAQPKHPCSRECQMHEPARLLLAVLDDSAKKIREAEERGGRWVQDAIASVVDPYLVVHALRSGVNEIPGLPIDIAKVCANRRAVEESLRDEP